MGHPVFYTLKGSEALLFQHLFVTFKHTDFLLASERRRIFSRRFSPFKNRGGEKRRPEIRLLDSWIFYTCKIARNSFGSGVVKQTAVWVARLS